MSDAPDQPGLSAPSTRTKNDELAAQLAALERDLKEAKQQHDDEIGLLELERDRQAAALADLLVWATAARELLAMFKDLLQPDAARALFPRVLYNRAAALVGSVPHDVIAFASQVSSGEAHEPEHFAWLVEIVVPRAAVAAGFNVREQASGKLALLDLARSLLGYDDTHARVRLAPAPSSIDAAITEAEKAGQPWGP